MTAETLLYMLRIEVDGHFHGGPPIKPWVAEVTGPCPRYGLARTFLTPMNDWRDARCAWSGNVYGKVATFPLREGRLYEIAQCRGKPSKRYLARQFYLIDQGKRQPRTPDEALALVDGGGPAATFLLRERAGSWVARVTGLGTPQRLGFVLVDEERHYRLRDGVYEVADDTGRRFVGVQNNRTHELLSEREALAWLT